MRHFTMECPRCRRGLRVPTEYVGKAVLCKSCDQTFEANPQAIAADPVDRRLQDLQRELEVARDALRSEPSLRLDEAKAPRDRFDRSKSEARGAAALRSELDAVRADRETHRARSDDLRRDRDRLAMLLEATREKLRESEVRLGAEVERLAGAVAEAVRGREDAALRADQLDEAISGLRAELNEERRGRAERVAPPRPGPIDAAALDAFTIEAQARPDDPRDIGCPSPDADPAMAADLARARDRIATLNRRIDELTAANAQVLATLRAPQPTPAPSSRPIFPAMLGRFRRRQADARPGWASSELHWYAAIGERIEQLQQGKPPR